jgi:4-hydroxy-3-polyprenylbenzoate decarboxylase
MSTAGKNIVLGITGASGAVYAVRLLDVLLAAGCRVQLSISSAGQTVIEEELGLKVDLKNFKLTSLLPDPERLQASAEFARLRTLLGPSGWGPSCSNDSSARGEVHYYHYQDLRAPMASGSALTDGMVVCPCSGGTLSAIAHAASGNLIQRAADVHLKERRKLILVPRETPLSLIQLDNMRRVVEAGAVMLPASPGFYHGVSTVRSLVDFVVARVADQLGLERSLVRRWGEPIESHKERS